MDIKYGKKQIWRFGFLARRIIDRKGYGAKDVAGKLRSSESDEEEMLGLLSDSFSSFPESVRAEELKSACLERAPRPAQETLAAGKGWIAPAGRVFPVLAKAGMAVALVLVVFIGMGFASVYAMPGNPLYSVKRAIESARVSFASGGESTAEQLLNNAEERLDEIEYVKRREMKGWYYSLADDAEGDMERAYREVEHICGRSAEEICSRAGQCQRRLRGLLEEPSQDLDPGEEEQLHQRMQQFRNEMDDSPGTNGGSSGGTVAPDGNTNPGDSGNQQYRTGECLEQPDESGTCPSDFGTMQQSQGESRGTVPGNKNR
ncbi:MAG: hypothetical protein JXA49_04165 [Actinobacteria bacterium]|nr:hypothetical protein [Actinomycetota bacterium]